MLVSRASRQGFPGPMVFLSFSFSFFCFLFEYRSDQLVVRNTVSFFFSFGVRVRVYCTGSIMAITIYLPLPELSPMLLRSLMLGTGGKAGWDTALVRMRIAWGEEGWSRS